MLSYNNERVVQQGEDWNLDILISQSNLEYVPFIVSSERLNPMIAITVASAEFEKQLRYAATWWLDLKDTPKFYQTVPEDLGEIATGLPITRPANPNTEDGFDPPMYALYRFTRQEDVIDSTGHKPYYYVYFTKEDPNSPNYDYKFDIRMQFKSQETSEWTGQNYKYQITLVDTISMGDWINLAHDRYPDLPWPTWITREDPNWIKPEREPGETTEHYYDRVEASWIEFRDNWVREHINELYPFIQNRIPGWFQPDIDIDSPVGFIDVPQSILTPTKLQVNNNLRKII